MLSSRGEGSLSGAEAELLCRLAAAGAGGSDGLPDGFSSIDWSRLAESAERHRLSSLVLEGIRRAGIEHRVFPEARERLVNARNLDVAKTVLHLHHLDELEEEASRAGWDLCLLKGAAFARVLYRDPASRPMADIDVLARPSEHEPWQARLAALGYELIDLSDHASCYRRRSSGVLLELHRELVSCASPLGLSGRSLFDRSVPLAPGASGRLRTLSWEDHLLHLCLHASFQHGFRQPAINAWDARSIAERTDFDARSFVDRSRDPRLARWVYGGLAMSAAVFPSERLTRLLEALAFRLPRRITRKARSLRAERLLASSRDSVFGSPIGRLLWAGGPRSTLSLLIEVSRPRSIELSRSPRAVVRRLVQLLRNHGMTALRSALGAAPQSWMSSRPASLGEVRDV